MERPMSPDISPSSPSTSDPDDLTVVVVTPTSLRALWWIPLILGLVAAVIGVIVIVWPEATVKVVAVLFGINLLIYGVMRVIQAILAPVDSVALRILYGLLGVVSIVIGVLCLRNLLQTVTVIVLLVGLSWLISGIIELIVTLSSSGPPSQWTGHTAVELGAGIIAVLAGLVVLAYPKVSLGTLVVLLGISLLVYGVVSIFAAFRLRAIASA
jgi:uncharacterized membrane protein HdeD (DUF308 family)